MMNFDSLRSAVLEWAADRGILAHGTAQAQALKMFEEGGELAAGIARQDRDLIADGLGDTLVTILILAELLEMDPVVCLEGAYKVIRHRKGYLNSSGIFVKE